MDLFDISYWPFLAFLLDNVLEAGYTDFILVVGFRDDLIGDFLKRVFSPPDFKMHVTAGGVSC